MNIKFTLSNIGPIVRGEIDLNDLTVLVGMNSTGKSLISKSAYISLRSLNLSDEELSGLIEDEAYKPELYRNVKGSALELYVNEDLKLKMSFGPLRIETSGFQEGIAEITYVDGPLVINEVVPTSFSLQHNDDLKRKLIHPKFGFTMTDPDRGREINNLFNEVLDGHQLEYQEKEDQFYLRLSESLTVPANRSPNGIKSFLILQKLFNNGYLTPNSVLILDEPEILSHPSWQLNYAHILLKLAKYYHLKVVVNSCSLYFIEALELYSKSYSLIADFYLGSKQDDGYNYVKENESLQKIYNALLDPYEKLDDLRMRYGKND